MLDFGLLEDMATARGMSAIIISISGSEGNFFGARSHATFKATLRNTPLTVGSAQRAAPEAIDFEGGFAEAIESRLTVVAAYIARRSAGPMRRRSHCGATETTNGLC